jgi:hypothetical protein
MTQGQCRPLSLLSLWPLGTLVSTTDISHTVASTDSGGQSGNGTSGCTLSVNNIVYQRETSAVDNWILLGTYLRE